MESERGAYFIPSLGTNPKSMRRFPGGLCGIPLVFVLSESEVVSEKATDSFCWATETGKESRVLKFSVSHSSLWTRTTLKVCGKCEKRLAEKDVNVVLVHNNCARPRISIPCFLCPFQWPNRNYPSLFSETTSDSESTKTSGTPQRPPGSVALISD